MIKDTDKSAHEFGFNVETLVKCGGCAFPFVIELDDNKSMAYSNGMTLRDYFAAAFVKSGTVFPTSFPVNTPDRVAKQAYELADAMLAARNK